MSRRSGLILGGMLATVLLGVSGALMMLVGWRDGPWPLAVLGVAMLGGAVGMARRTLGHDPDQAE